MVRSKASSSSKNDSSKEFEGTFSSQFGQRWPAIKKALMQPTQLVAMENLFTGHSLEGDDAFVTWHSAHPGFPPAFRLAQWPHSLPPTLNFDNLARAFI